MCTLRGCVCRATSCEHQASWPSSDHCLAAHLTVGSLGLQTQASMLSLTLVLGTQTQVFIPVQRTLSSQLLHAICFRVRAYISKISTLPSRYKAMNTSVTPLVFLNPAAGERVEAFASKPNNLHVIPWTHTLSSDLDTCIVACTPTPKTQINKMKFFKFQISCPDSKKKKKMDSQSVLIVLF